MESAIAQKFPVTQFDHQLKFTDIAARIVQVAGVRLEELSWLLMAENNCIVLPLQLPQIRFSGVLPLSS